jgi:transglutaminase-like putative cysteine protease
MELEIVHTTRYEFSQPVFLDPHLFRFQPRSDGAQVLANFELEIRPEPVGRAAWLDAAGNATTHAWFEGLHANLSVAARAVVDIHRENPFDFLLDVSRTRLPVDYGREADLLFPYLRRVKPPQGDRDEVAVLASRMRHVSGDSLVPLLTALNNTLCERLIVERREEGDPWPPERTWQYGRGACRDLAVLFVDACRALGIAARFVSGYEQPAGFGDNYDLHAWAEVYIPGGGWRGYDPSRGLAVGPGYVSVAAAASAEDAAPVTGSFRGSGVFSTIESHIRIEQPGHALAG